LYKSIHYSFLNEKDTEEMKKSITSLLIIVALYVLFLVGLSPKKEAIYLITNFDKVKAYEKADSNAKVLIELPKGEQLEVVSKTPFFETIDKETDFWYQVKEKEKLVWIFGAFTNLNLNDNLQVLEAKYEGASMGDYFHLNFQSTDAKKDAGWKRNSFGLSGNGNWDFGYSEGLNHLEDYNLALENEDTEGNLTNPQYKQKTFLIQWKVKLINTWAGDGELSSVRIEVPYIENISIKN
jgi:hypothetical protein